MPSTLPLHPRRAQQLFQEVLLTDAGLTPHFVEKSLPQRVHEFQRLNLSGIQEGKRGTTFQRIRAATESIPHVETEEIVLQLTKDGSTLHFGTLSDGDEVASARLLDIKGCMVHEAPMHSFSLYLDVRGDGDANNVGTHNTIEATDVFVASTAEILNHWIVTLTCGVNAFQQQHNTEATSLESKAADLVWQAVRLRIFELAAVMPLPTAITHVRNAIPEQDYQQSDSLQQRLQFLTTSISTN